ncbi:MAG: RagB/SusD family nutrient uptake outer membrane protein [Chitinophagaceae bacterium]|nr:RagB/SusD family nutrient uptake outer membrane protein [Chitinophagaceae bacterium]
MKNILAIGALLSIILISPACKKSIDEFLEKAPGVDVNEDIVFSTQQNIDAFVATLYQYSMFSILPVRIDGNVMISNPATGAAATQIGTLSAATDEGKNEGTFQFANNWNNATILNSNIIASEDYRYYARWKAIRMANIIIERIDTAPGAAADENFRKYVKAQAKFLRALSNFELLKRYGGFPLVMKRYVSVEEAVQPRSTFAECVEAIIKDCDEAFPDLELTYQASQRGRITQLAVRALQSRTLLYAASPLFNTGTPYLSMPNAEDNKYICYGNYDKSRWTRAADTARAVLDLAAMAGVSLVDVAGNRVPKEAKENVTSFLAGNYRVSWERQDNSEIILADKSSLAAGNNFSFPWQHIMPVPMGGFFGGTSVLLNFVKKYEDISGNKVVWNDAGGDDLVAKYASLDPRFRQSIGYNGSRWNPAHPIISTYEGGQHARGCFGGAWMLKHCPEVISNGSVLASIPLFRLNEFYLNYAEAANEAGSSPPASAYNEVNKIRTRSGMPNLPTGLTTDQFRERVRNERAVELAFEDHRFWDIRRWLIAEEEGVMRGGMYGIRVKQLTGNALRYEPYLIENRSFNKNMYLHPFDLTEVLKGNLLQNPGW